GQTIAIDLAAPPEVQLAHYRNDHCRNIASVRKLGATCLHDTNGHYLDAFIEMYLDTMRRACADSGFFFDQEYFNFLTSKLGDKVHLFVCLFEGKAISG